MNILFVGSTRGSSTSLFYYTSLLALGHRVLPWEPGFFQTETPWEKVAQRLNRGPTPWSVKQINEKLISVCRENQFDLVFVMGENFVSAEAMEAVRGLGQAPRFVFHSHDNVFSDGIVKPRDFFQTLTLYDVVFTTKSQNVERYGQLGQARAYYLPSAYEPMVHRPIPRAESRCPQDYAATFVGTYDGSRDRWVQAAGWENLHVWGDGWHRYSGFAHHGDRVHASAVYYFQFADICSRSQIALGLLREEAEDRHTQRTFEIPACGTLQIAPRNDEIREFFEEGKQIVLYDSPEELRDKVSYFLNHPLERERIAQQGHERCLKSKHTYLDRAREMLTLLGKSN